MARRQLGCTRGEQRVDEMKYSAKKGMKVTSYEQEKRRKEKKNHPFTHITVLCIHHIW